MATLPTDLHAVAAELDATAAAADALANRLSEAQFRWQPDQGRAWSVAQCLNHLTKGATLYLERMRPAIDTARASGATRYNGIKMSGLGRRFAASQEPTGKRRFRAPSKIQPGPPRSRDDVMRTYRDVHRELAAAIEASATIDVNRTTFPNPFFPLIRMRVGTGFRILAAHERRHLWQAQRVTEGEGFPQE